MRLFLPILLSVTLVALPAHAEPSAGAKTQTIQLVSTAKGKPRVLRDRVPKGTLSPGDVFSESSTLRNAVAQFGRPKGAIVGSDVATYTLVSVSRADVKGTARLPGGTIRIAATLTSQRIPSFRVIGGSGAFAHARGALELRESSAPGSALNIYHLRLP